MMDDRFSAQLRQHLLNTADERPADGRLAAIIEGVADTPQRHPLVSRLPRFRGRTDPFRSSAMRFGLIAIALIIAILGAALAVGVGQPGRTVFDGTWMSIDSGDGSTQTLRVAAGISPAVRFVDDFASGAACMADEIKIFTMDGTGTIADDRLDVVWPHGGGCGSVKVVVGPGSYTYDQATDTIVDGEALRWTRVEGSVLPPSSAPTTEPNVMPPPPSAPPTAHPGETTFASTVHGFSMGVPPGWQTRPATEPWGGGQLDFDSPAADVIFDPKYGDGLYLLVASQSFNGMSEDEWSGEVLAWTCPESPGEFWSWRVDEAYSFQRGPCNSGSIVATDTRGYLIRSVASSTEPGLVETYAWDWLKRVLETVDLRPDEAIDPPGSGAPVPRCADIAAGGTYGNRFGTPKLSATVPVVSQSQWQGYRDEFALARACPFGGPIRITASMVDAVIDHACDPWTRSPVGFGTLTEAAEVIVAQPGHRSSEPTEVTIADRAALRLEISTEGSACSDGIGLWYGNEFSLDEDAIVYLVEMDGDTLAIAVWYDPSQTTPAQLAEAESIVASIQNER
jgi:hypothetical protein